MPNLRIIHNCFVDFNQRYYADSPVHLVQYDDKLPILAVQMFSEGKKYYLPAGMVVNIRFGKKDGTCVYNPAMGYSEDRNIVYIEITQQMTVEYGRFEPVIEVVNGTQIACSSYIPIVIDRNPIQEGQIESTDEYKTIQALSQEVIEEIETLDGLVEKTANKVSDMSEIVNDIQYPTGRAVINYVESMSHIMWEAF